MELRGFEPLTSSMRTKRATNCAIAPETNTTLRRKGTRRLPKVIVKAAQFPNRDKPRKLSGLQPLPEGQDTGGVLRGQVLAGAQE